MVANFKANIWKLYFFNFFISLHFMGAVIVPFYTDWGGLNFFQIMLLQGSFMFWIFILQIPAGTIADYFGRKKSLIIGCFINIFAVLIYGSVPNFYIFMIAEFLWGMANAFYFGATDAFLYDTLKEIDQINKSKKIFGRIDSFSIVGFMVGALFGSFIVKIFDLRATMLFLIFPFSIAFIFGLTFKEPSHEPRMGSRRYITILKEGVKFFSDNKVLKILALDMIFIGSVVYFLYWLYQPMLEELNVDIFYFGFVYAFMSIGQIMIMNNYERLENILGSKRRLLTFSSIITGAMLVMGGLIKILPVVILAIILGSSFGFARRPLFINYMNKFISSDKRATVLSTISMFERCVLAICNPLVGLLVDWSLSYTLIILGTAALIFSSLSKTKETDLID